MARKFWRGDYRGKFEFDANSGVARGPFDIDDQGDTNPPSNNGSSQVRLFASGHTFSAGEMVMIDGDYEDFDGPWEILAVNTPSAGYFDIGLAWDSNYASASFNCTATVHSNWCDENGADVAKPAAGDVVVFNELAIICPADTDDVDRFATANAAKQELDKHFNCFADMAQGDIALEAVIIDSLFTGHVGVYYDRSVTPNEAVITPLKLDLAASGELHFRGTRTAYIMCSDNSGGAAEVPITIHNCGNTTGQLYLCSDGVLAAFTEVRVLGTGRLEGIDQYDLEDVSEIEDVEEGVRINTLGCYGSGAEIDIHQKASKLGVIIHGTNTFDCDAGDTVVSYSSTGLDGLLAVGDIVYLTGEARYVVAVTTSSFTAHKAYASDHENVLGYKLAPMDINAYAGTLYTNSPIGDLVAAGAQNEVGSSSFRSSERLDINDAQILAGTTNWRAMGRLRAATINGGTLNAVGSGKKIVGLTATGELIKVLAGTCDFSACTGLFEIIASSYITKRGGSLVLPDNIEIDWAPTLTE